MNEPSEKLVSNVLSRISQRSWKSARRRSYLERLATLAVGSDVRVKFTNIETAACKWDENRQRHEIMLRSDELKMRYLDEFAVKMDKGSIHTLTQEGFLYHELGHVLITDYDAWMSSINQYDNLSKKAQAKQILNAVEDVVLEAWLRDYFSCGRIFDFKNAVKFHVAYQTKQSDDDKSVIYERLTNSPFDELLWAVETEGRFDAGIDWNQFPNSEVARSHAIDMISDAVVEPNAQKRYEGILDKLDTFLSETESSYETSNIDQFDDSSTSQSGEQESTEQQIEMMIPESGDDIDDDEDDGGGSGGSQSDESESRTVEEILGEHDPENCKVVM